MTADELAWVSYQITYQAAVIAGEVLMDTGCTETAARAALQTGMDASGSYQEMWDAYFASVLTRRHARLSAENQILQDLEQSWKENK